MNASFANTSLPTAAKSTPSFTSAPKIADTKGQPVMMEIPKTVDQMLVNILAWPRPHDSFSELRFRAWLAAHIRFDSRYTVEYLANQCMYVNVKTPEGKQSTTLFSCHIDTCDNPIDGQAIDTTPPGEAIAGSNLKPKSKDLTYDPVTGIITLDPASLAGGCLGADDGVGVWLMYKMLEAGVPGGYLFHTAEEVGGQGSRAVLVANEDTLKTYEVAIAFDRPRCNEVITHQGGSECASDKCGTALMQQLNKHGFDYGLSRGGTFTDTKVYRGVIPECLNLGVGYEFQHGRKEILHYQHALALSKALIEIEWESLPVDRDHTKPDPIPYRSHGGFGMWDGGHDLYGDDMWGSYPSRDNNKGKSSAHVSALPTAKKGKKSKALPPVYEPLESVFDEMLLTDMDALYAFCGDDPGNASDTIVQLLVEIGKLRAENAVLQALLPRSSNSLFK